MSWALSTRWAPLRDEAPDLDAVRAADPPAVALARGLPDRLTPAVLRMARELEIAWVEGPWPDADVAPIDSDDRHLRADAIKAAVRTIEGANRLECGLVVATVTGLGDPARFALDPLLSAALRHGATLALRGEIEPAALAGLLRELAGAPLGWVVDLAQPQDLADAAGEAAAAYVLPDPEADLQGWPERLAAAPPRVLDVDPDTPAEALHERAAEALAKLEAE